MRLYTLLIFHPVRQIAMSLLSEAVLAYLASENYRAVENYPLPNRYRQDPALSATTTSASLAQSNQPPVAGRKGLLFIFTPRTQMSSTEQEIPSQSLAPRLQNQSQSR